MVFREKCRLVFVSCLNLTRKWSLHHFVSFPQWINYSLQLYGVFLSDSFNNIIQEIDGVCSSSNVCVASIICVVLLSETVLNEAEVELVGVELFLAEMILLHL